MKSQINYNYFLIFFLLFTISKDSISNECLTKKNLNIGIIEDNYIDYKYYLYYALGDYSTLNDVEFTINKVNHNVNEFDIIFGEYRDLEKLSSKQTEIPDKVLNFYKNNEIEIISNLLPLDLDTFILLSKDKVQKLTFEEFSELYSPIKYTLGMSFLTKEDIINLLIYHLEQPSIDINKVSFELLANLFIKSYKNINKNIINNNFSEVYSSFENSENVFTLFSDGILLNKNTNFESFQLFPKSKYIWSNEEGIFQQNLETIPLSFFGFSAYLNNFKSSGFLCYLVDEKVRLKAFKDFNIQLGPLSINEVKSIEKELHKEYVNILLNKNKNIFKPNYSLEYKNYDLFSEVFFGKKNLDTIFYKADFLNK